jgi:hypothetical protein
VFEHRRIATLLRISSLTGCPREWREGTTGLVPVGCCLHPGHDNARHFALLFRETGANADARESSGTFSTHRRLLSDHTFDKPGWPRWMRLLRWLGPAWSTS